MQLLFLLVIGMIAFSPGPAGAVSMTNDPKGFHNIVWGTALNTRPDLELTRQGRNIIEYQFKDTLKKDGPSMLLIKVNEFAEDAGRVVLDPPDITKRFMKAIE